VGASQYTEVIKGPPPIVYGGGKVGGVLNFVPKSARNKEAVLLAEPEAQTSVTLGSYDKRLATAEVGLPFSIGGLPSGAYVYAQLEDSDHYYKNIYNKNALLQLAREGVAMLVAEQNNILAQHAQRVLVLTSGRMNAAT